MGRIVVMAEKPSVGRDIARVLGCKEKGDGCLFNDTYLVTWAVGHLVALCDPDEIDESYKKWRRETLPILPESFPLKVLPKTRSQFSTVKKLICAKETDSLICATDAGREGELIFRFIYEKSGCSKPFSRLWISSMTDEAIKEGFAAIKPGEDYDGLYRSAICRAQADWLVGMNASRAFTLKYNVLLSIGRVQTPTLAILVRRQDEIDRFVPEEYYTLTADFGDYVGTWFRHGAENDTRLPTKEAADAIAAAVKNGQGTVTSLEKQQKQDWPPLLYDLTTLQRDANRMAGFTAKKTLALAQSLYEKHKVITYPRTDSRCLPHDMVGRATQAVRNVPDEYKQYIQPAMPEGKLTVSKRIFDDTKISDHHAIIPTTKKCDMSALSPDERKLMDIILRRLLAAFSPVHQYEQTRAVTTVGENTFRTVGKTVTQPGWKTLYPPSGKDKEETPLPELKEGDTREVHGTRVKRDATKPPPLHNDASLLSAMENAGKESDDEELRDIMKGSGLGTPATRAAIIERLLEVGYAARKGKNIIPTEKGIQLIRVAPEEIASPETTGRWELALDKIARDEQDPVRFMEGIRRLSSFLVDYAAKAEGENPFPPEERKGRKTGGSSKQLPDTVCPVCGQGKVAEGPKGFFCSRWKEGCHFTVWKDCLTKSGGPAISAKLLTMLLEKKTLAGSTGTLEIKNGKLCFTGKDGRQTMRDLIYEKKA